DDNKFEYDFSGPLDNTLFSSTGFNQSSSGTELSLTATQGGWLSQFLSNERFTRRDGLTFEGSVFIPYGGYKAVMIGFHDGINNGTEGIAHGLYFFENGSAADVEIAARHGGSASPMPAYRYENPSSPGSWFDYKIVLHPAGATYYVKRDTESTYTNVLTFDGGIDLTELKLGIQATTGSYTTNYTAHKNWKVYQSEVTPNANGIIYVKASGAGTSTGDSWANAAAELSDALKAAKTLNETAPETVKEIWVARGTYKPRYSPEDGADFGTDQGRNNAFLLVKDVKIYGGFAGTETALANRNLSSAANRTTLSGDFNDDDVITGSGSTLSITGNSENAYQVVISTGN